MPTKPQLFPRSAGLLGLAFALGGLAATAAAQDDLAGSLFLPGAPPAIDSIFSDASPVAPTNLAGSPPPGETPPAVVGYPPSSAETLPLVEPPAAEGLVFLTKQGTPPPEPVEAKPEKQPLTGFFDDGFKFESTDGEFQLQIHNETQLDLRAYAEKLDPVDQFGFTVPRMRLIFNGHLTKPIEYNVSINKGLGSLDLLDAFFNFNYDPRFQVRIGRFRAPFTYDWYALSNQFLLTPERSIFAINYGYNRNVGGMIHGEVLDERLDYAVAVVNGPRNSYIDENAAKDVLGYVNVRPFGQSESFPFLHNLNLGGAVAYGEQDQFPNPIAFRT
ncbi:MAG TPA: porin, partial [Pirellulales bacterium]